MILKRKMAKLSVCTVVREDLHNRTGVRSNTRPQISAFLGNRSRDSGTLHFTLVVNDDASVIFEVDEKTFLSSPSFSLANNDGRVHLLSQFRLSLLARSHDQVTNGSRGKSVQSTLDTVNGNDHQGLRASVISAVDCGGDRQSCR